MSNSRPLTNDDIDELAFQVHEWFVNNPLGTTEEGYDHFVDWFQRWLEPFSNGYMDYNS